VGGRFRVVGGHRRAAVLDGTRLLERDGRVRVEEVRRRLAPRLALVPRFRQLLAAWAQLGRRRLDPSRPLWAAWLLPGLPDHRVGLFVRAHHTMADGVAGIAPGPSGRDAARLGGGVA
jgi:diacylglycerol O-acyltransferase